MKHKIYRLFEEGLPEPEKSFHAFWEMEKKGMDESTFFSEGNIDPEFTTKTSIDWQQLQAVANKRTEFERLWDWAGASGKKIAIAGTAGVLLSPIIVALVFTWTKEKIQTGSSFDIVVGWSILFFTIGLATMLIASPLYLLYKRIPIPPFRKRSLVQLEMIAALTVSLCIVVVVILTTDSFSGISGDYKIVNINGNEKFVLKKYSILLHKPSEEVISQIEDSFKINPNKKVDPELLNALALQLENNGKKLQAEIAYSLASKNDPYNTVESYQLNTKIDVANARNASYLYSVPVLNRYTTSNYSSYFTSDQQIENLSKIKCTPTTSLELLNAKAIALEYLGDYSSALLTYKCALNPHKPDPVVLTNVRKFLENRPVDSLEKELGNKPLFRGYRKK